MDYEEVIGCMNRALQPLGFKSTTLDWVLEKEVGNVSIHVVYSDIVGTIDIRLYYPDGSTRYADFIRIKEVDDIDACLQSCCSAVVMKAAMED